MARRAKGTVPWKVWVPEELALRTELRYLDPMTGKPIYAARSHLITALLLEFDKAVTPIERERPGLVKNLIERIIREGELATVKEQG